jgi:hypothetical protein
LLKESIWCSKASKGIGNPGSTVLNFLQNFSTSKNTSPLKGTHVISTQQIDLPKLNYLIDLAKHLREAEQASENPRHRSLLAGKILGNLFFEPSTRTTSSFAAAAIKLGGRFHFVNINLPYRIF